MRACSYDCDYNKDDKCTYEGETACVNDKPTEEKTEVEILEDALSAAKEVVSIPAEEAKRLLTRLKSFETIEDIYNVLNAHGWIESSKLQSKGNYAKIARCSNCDSSIKSRKGCFVCHNWDSPCWLKETTPDFYCACGNRRR